MRYDDAAIYVRVSTTKESQKFSPEHQRMDCEEKARQLSLKVREEYIYVDRDSGTSIVGRPSIQTLIEDATKGCFKTILFSSLSRFSRDTYDSLGLKRILVDKLGLRVVSLDENYDSEVDKEEFKFQIFSAVNQKLSEQISISSRRGIRQSGMKGNFLGTIAPLGYDKVKVDDRKTIVPNERAILVQLIFDMYVNQKMGEKEIVKYLNKEEIPSYKGGKWGITSVERILTNEIYTGKNIFNKFTVVKVYNDINNMSDRSKKLVKRDKELWEESGKQTHEAIISEELFRKAQEVRLKRGGGKRGGVRNKVNVFAGIIKCKHCESSLNIVTSNGKKNTYRYLVCSKRRRQGETGCGNHNRIPYDDFKDALIQSLSEKLRAKIKSGKAITITKKAREDTGKLIIKLEKQIQNARKLLFEIRKQKLNDEIDDEQYEFEKEQYEQEIKQKQAQLSKMKDDLERDLNDNEQFNEIIISLDELSNLSQFTEVDQVNLILKKLVSNITVDNANNVEIHSVLGRL
ncbi:recombinase family protein [Paenibacillus sp. SZ31]|uniref:recombinase family protein n=1 Tax=Paenibacillus sp. SZ31 TaxID=2725555 RepID=UPI00146F81CC|nr:recombinase family protein [Paenibacillus sp. SZ31]NMI04798.1 recombinase family protein [Paenibacillus sp. SZ31]